MTLSDQEYKRDEVLTLFDKGWPATAIAKASKVNPSLVYHLVAKRREAGDEPKRERPKPPPEALALLKPRTKPKGRPKRAAAKHVSQVEFIDVGATSSADQRKVLGSFIAPDSFSELGVLRREVRALRLERDALRTALDALLSTGE